MKIVFAVPPYHMAGYHVPQGIGVVATVAKAAGHDVSVFMPQIIEHKLQDEDSFNIDLLNHIAKWGADIVALGGMSPSYMQIKHLIQLLKTNWNGIVVLGGYIVDASQNVVPCNIGADYCIYGEGEYTFVELASALENGQDISNVDGLIYMKEGNPVKTKPRKCVSILDELPFIDADLTHLDESLQESHSLDVLLSRSCPFQCTFCYHIENAPYRKKSLDYVFTEIKHYISKYGHLIKHLRISDDTFGADKKQTLEFADRIEKLNLVFGVQTRVDMIDEEINEFPLSCQLHYSYCSYQKAGFPSGDFEDRADYIEKTVRTLLESKMVRNDFLWCLRQEKSQGSVDLSNYLIICLSLVFQLKFLLIV